MFKHLLFLLCFLGGAHLAGQAINIKQALPASVEKVMAFETPTVNEIDTVLKVSFRYIFANADTCLFLAEHALALSERLYPGEVIHAESFYCLGDAHRSRNEWAESEAAIVAGQEICKRLGLESKTARGDLKLGALYIQTERYEEALNHQFSALSTWERLNDSTHMYKPWFEISAIFRMLNQLPKALEYNAKILAWGKAINAPRMTMYAQNNRASMLKEYANSFFVAADTISSDSTALLDSVRYYQELALATFNEAMPNYRKYGGNRNLATLLINITNLKIDLGQYDEALSLAAETADLTERLNAHELRMSNSVRLAMIYRATGRPALAVKEALKGLESPVADKKVLVLHDLQTQLYLAHKDLGQFEEALYYQEQVTAFREKNEATERNEIVNSIEAKYQTAQKEKQIFELNVANAAIKRKSNRYMLGAALLTMFGFLGFQLTRIRRERNQKAAFTEALIDAQEDERKRIARDLHDGIGQSLLVIKQQLGVNKNSTLENQQLIAATLEEVRTISRDLHPVLLEKFGITSTIKDTVERIAAMAPELFISSEIDDIDGLLLPKTEVQIFRTVQEALSNVVKHADASAAKVTVSKRADQIEVLIQDNGKSFDYELAVARSKSMGLRTMFERITSAGGKFAIKSKPGSGTEITATVPIRKTR
jgi:signal transduction histidine kinase